MSFGQPRRASEWSQLNYHIGNWPFRTLESTGVHNISLIDGLWEGGGLGQAKPGENNFCYFRGFVEAFPSSCVKAFGNSNKTP